MHITVTLDEGELRAEGLDRVVPVSCDVRNEINGRRRPEEVVYAMPSGKPYYPRQFPRGVWSVTDIRARSDPYRAPYYIATDARQIVDEWSVVEVDGKPRYDRPTGRRVVDAEYGLHYSTSSTTTGCIRIRERLDLLDLVDLIRPALARGEAVSLEVV